MRFTPNEESYIGFAAVLTGTLSAPKLADITGAVDLTDTVMGLTASTTGQSVPTPSFRSKFETSIPGNVSASFSMDCYRYNVPAEDLAWTTLPRGTSGFMLIARYVTSGLHPVVGDTVEVWPIDVLSRSVPNMTSNTPVSTTITASVPTEPAEDAVIVT